MDNLLRFDPIARRVGTEPAKRRLEDLVSGDKPAERVRELDPLYLYSLVKEVGVADALPVLHLSSGEQAQALLDFDCWDSDRVALDRLSGWLAAHFQGPIDHVEELHHCLDPELLGLLLKRRIRVYFYEDEDDAELIDRIPGPIESSPDGVFAMVMPEEAQQADFIRQLIRRLYATDQDRARQLLRDARHDLASTLEETAYQMRTGRLQDHGLPPFEEALELYAPVAPNRERAAAREALRAQEATLELRVEGPVAVPYALADPLIRITDQENGSFVGRALRRVADASSDLAVTDRLLLQLKRLVNQTVVANRDRPGHPEDTLKALGRAHGMLNVGLEYLAGRDGDRAVQLLVRWPLKRIFRSGFSLVAAVAAQARALVDRSTLTLVEELPYSLCSRDETNLLAGLLEPRPMRSALEGLGFSDLDQVESAARGLALLAYKALGALETSGLSRDDLVASLSAPGVVAPVDTVTFDALLATRAGLAALVGADEKFRLLTRGELATIIADHIHDDGLSDELANAVATVAAPPRSADSSAAPLAARWASDLSLRLVEEYGGLDQRAMEATHLLPTLLLFQETGEDSPS